MKAIVPGSNFITCKTNLVEKQFIAVPLTMIYPTGKRSKKSTIKIAQVHAIYESYGQSRIEIK